MSGIITWSRIVKAMYAAGGVMTVAGVDSYLRKNHKITSKDGAPPPGSSFSPFQKIKYACESGGGFCTCDDVRDWLAVYADSVIDMKTLIKNLKRKITSGSSKFDDANHTIKEAEAFIKNYRFKYGDPKDWSTFSCDEISDDLWCGTACQVVISDIYKKIGESNDIGVLLTDYYNEYKLPSDVMAWDLHHREIDPDVRRQLEGDGDGGPDSESIGLGLLAGGAIAVALIMVSKDKTKGRV